MATIKGQWRWNAVIDLSVTLDMTSGNIPRGFISNGETYDNLHVFNDVHWNPDPRVCDCLIYGNSMDIASLFQDDKSFVWASQEYRIMDFGETEQEISEELYAFIVANAVYQPSTIAEKLEFIAENERKVYDAGKKAEYDAFWDAYQPTTALFPYQFTSKAWNDGNFFPKKDMVGNGNIFGAFYGLSVTDLVKRLNDCSVKIDTSNATNMGALFQYSDAITIPKISCKSATNIGSAFHSCYVLKTIECLEVHENLTYNATFGYCNNLENITFEGVIGQDLDIQWCTKLTRASIESIINHLSDTATGKTLTLSKTAVDEAFEWYFDSGDPDVPSYWIPGTDEINPIWPNLRDSKPNWTITLV